MIFINNLNHFFLNKYHNILQIFNKHLQLNNFNSRILIFQNDFNSNLHQKFKSAKKILLYSHETNKV